MLAVEQQTHIDGIADGIAYEIIALHVDRDIAIGEGMTWGYASKYEIVYVIGAVIEVVERVVGGAIGIDGKVTARVVEIEGANNVTIGVIIITFAL